MKQLLMFSLGVAAGSVATYFIVKNHFQDISDDEIATIKEAYRIKVEAVDRVRKIQEEKEKYKNIIFKSDYSPDAEAIEEDSNFGEEDEDNRWERERLFPEEESEDPYSITPSQFVNEKGYYDKVTMYYYDEDGTYCNESEDIITNPVDLFGETVSFGEFEDDVAYIRNDKISTDFEIIRNHASYSEINQEFED